MLWWCNHDDDDNAYDDQDDYNIDDDCDEVFARMTVHAYSAHCALRLSTIRWWSAYIKMISIYTSSWTSNVKKMISILISRWSGHIIFIFLLCCDSVKLKYKLRGRSHNGNYLKINDNVLITMVIGKNRKYYEENWHVIN